MHQDPYKVNTALVRASVLSWGNGGYAPFSHSRRTRKGSNIELLTISPRPLLPPITCLKQSMPESARFVSAPIVIFQLNYRILRIILGILGNRKKIICNADIHTMRSDCQLILIRSSNYVLDPQWYEILRSRVARSLLYLLLCFFCPSLFF